MLPTHLWCYRELLQGIGAFANAKGTWRVRYFTPQDNVVALVQGQPTDGALLGELYAPEVARTVATLVGRTVGVCADYARRGVDLPAEVLVADERVGELAADHLAKKRYVSYAYLGDAEDGDPGGRFAGYRRRLAAHGHEPAFLAPGWESVTTGRGWLAAYPSADVRQFLAALPKPLAVMAYNDGRGREIVQGCTEAGLNVPEDVAVVGVDDDPLDCALCHPPLSSVAVPWRRIGYVAAHVLDRLLDGEAVDRVTAVDPVGVVERQSTDSVAIADPDVASALLFIREHAHVPFGVDDVAHAARTGRRTLEKRFRALLGRSLLEEVRRVRIKRATELLAQTDLPVSEVARRSGYAELTWFSTAFRTAVGTSPREYRRKSK